MKRFIVMASAAILFLGTASSVTAQRDSVERSTRMDTDALRDDVRTDRLQVPKHPLAAEELPQPAPGSKKKAKRKKSSENNQ